MGWDYALVHLYYNIPPALLLTIAVISTTPWDSYLIRRQIWTYPSDAIVGPTLFRIPAEEVFFFIIQTYNTSLLYLLASVPTFHPIHLCGELSLTRSKWLKRWKWIGVSLLVAAMLTGAGLVVKGGEGLYLGLIIVWAGPFILLLWSLSFQLLLGLPISNTILPILMPTLYLWIVDTLALRRGTWVIESGTKLGWHLWDGLDVEEAFFFLVTNTLIVFGLVAFDNALAILETFPTLFPTLPTLPSPIMLVEALLVSLTRYDDQRIQGLEEALRRLRQKSRSFYLASGCFQGRLRIDLVLLYSFCRVADDLVDNVASGTEARHWILKLTKFLDICYAGTATEREMREDFVKRTFPRKEQAALLLLPTTHLSPTPLYDLLKGFETDLEFSFNAQFPITNEETLQVYASRVAGTVAELCLELVFYHTKESIGEEQQRSIVNAGGRMGIALQYVNICRDIAVDARIQRVYLPTEWLKSQGLSPEDVIDDPTNTRVEALRQRLLDHAMTIYDEARRAIVSLPKESRAAMRVAVESYVEIGRVLQKSQYKLKAGRATVPKLRRLKVAWTALKKG
ncbi:MAG: hypothetical protein Q9170_000684 [Blastenia crenularia]